jgi:hypothetical protein
MASSSSPNPTLIIGFRLNSSCSASTLSAEGERLITAGREHWGHHTPFMILPIHAGIEEMKRAREAPDPGNRAFPPISVIHIEGDAIGACDPRTRHRPSSGRTP